MYHELPRFAELVSNGDINLSSSIPLKSMDHNMIHNISFLDHCNHLCKKNKTNLLRLLSVLLQKLNGDMIMRVNKYPQLNSNIQSAIGEWSENIEPMDLFRCPDSCYDSENVVRLHSAVQGYDSEFSRLNENTKDDSNLYESLDSLKNNYHECDEDLRNNLIQLDERTNEYDPPYRKILDDLSTRPKSFYMSDLLNGDSNINNNVNMRLSKGIPENIHVIFLNSVLLSTLISKCMEGHKSECMKLKEILSKKNNEIEDIMGRIGPGVPLSDSIMNFISGVKDFFDENDNSLPSDDEEEVDEVDETTIANVLDKIVNKKEVVNVDPNPKIDDGDDDDMYHLKIVNSDNEHEDEEENEEDNGEDNEEDNEDSNNDNEDSDQISFYD